MNIDTKKVELIDWIAQLNDQHSINMVLTLKKNLATKKKKSDSKIFGSGKNLIEYIAEDFNEPLAAFKEISKMNFLVDMHILLWYIVGDHRINNDTKNKIESNSNTVFLSNASLWEITIKVSIGKLKIKASLNELKNYLNEKNFKILDFDFNDLKTLQTLPFHHQDPFDRLIISQAKTKSLEIITNDRQVQQYF